MSQDRVIYHIDCNAFFASVEETLHPEYKAVPMAVCGNPENRRGIILAKNELAKRKGVKTAETIWQARQKCPNLTLAPARHGLYGEFCERVNKIYEEYTDQVERFGIDESYLDVTGSLHLFGNDPLALANRIRERIPRELGLTVSVGISYNKMFAKVASDMKKPNAVTTLFRHEVQQKLWPLPASVLMMVGKNTEAHLHRLNIHTVGELAGADVQLLRQELGKLGEQLHLYALGEDQSPVGRVGDESETHSVGNGMTFKRNLMSEQDVNTAITALADTVASRLRRYGLKCSTVQITIKDTQLKSITRQQPVKQPTWLAKEIAQAATELLHHSWRIGEPIRMLTITGMNLVEPGTEVRQLSLLEEPEAEEGQNKQEKLEKTMDQIRNKYGKKSITQAGVICNDLGIDEKHS